MRNDDIHIGQEYLRSYFTKAEAIKTSHEKSTQPAASFPNWADQPSRYKVYPDAERFPLPMDLPDQIASMATIWTRLTEGLPASAHLTWSSFSSLLFLAYSTLNGRVDSNWNNSDSIRALYRYVVHGRGTPSGGGLYPVEIYWASGHSGPFRPGIYHYDCAHHAMEQLYTGNVLPSIRQAAFHHPAVQQADHFLLITVNFWKNAFKYGSGCYHVVAEDVGAVLCSLRMLALGFGCDLSFIQWFQDMALNQLLGLDTVTESVFAIIPLPLLSSAKSNQNAADDTNQVFTHLPILDTPLHTKKSFQRSKEVLTFPFMENMHLSSLINQETRPQMSSVAGVAGETKESVGESILLPSPSLSTMGTDIEAVIQKRRSSFGKFSSHIPLTLAELATLLAYGLAVDHYRSDLKPEAETLSFIRIMVIANNVEYLPRGIYTYERSHHRLRVVEYRDVTLYLQSSYFLQNYNMAETGVVIALVGRPEALLNIYGNRGYRVMNMETGMIAQAIYLLATALQIGCGAALGFNTIAMHKILQLEEKEEQSMLFLLLGHERPNIPDFDYRLV